MPSFLIKHFAHVLFETPVTSLFSLYLLYFFLLDSLFPPFLLLISRACSSKHYLVLDSPNTAYWYFNYIAILQPLRIYHAHCNSWGSPGQDHRTSLQSRPLTAEANDLANAKQKIGRIWILPHLPIDKRLEREVLGGAKQLLSIRYLSQAVKSFKTCLGRDYHRS